MTRPSSVTLSIGVHVFASLVAMRFACDMLFALTVFHPSLFEMSISQIIFSSFRFALKQEVLFLCKCTHLTRFPACVIRVQRCKTRNRLNAF
jgi:hypothetical protein